MIIFNWKTYKIRGDEKYYQQAYWNRLHRDVWIYHNWDIPKWYDIHHKDENVLNNNLDNLELIESWKHRSEHMKKRFEDAEYKENNNKQLDIIRPLTKIWHWSEEWRNWHKEHYKNSLWCMPIHTLQCEQCWTDFETTDKTTSRFCSNKCKSQFRRDSWVDNITRDCIKCWEWFIINKYYKTQQCKVCRNKRFK